MTETTPENDLQLQASQSKTDEKPANKRVDISFLFKDSLKADGTIDLRSNLGRSFKAIKDLIKTDRFQAAENILINDLAMLQIIERAIQCKILSNPDEIFQEDGLNPLLGSSFLRFRDAKYRAMSLLLNLKNKKSNKNKNRDLSDITFD